MSGGGGGAFPWLHIPGCEAIGSLNLDWRFKGQRSEAPQSGWGGGNRL